MGLVLRIPLEQRGPQGERRSQTWLEGLPFVSSLELEEWPEE
jgi:hypothetical protein